MKKKCLLIVAMVAIPVIVAGCIVVPWHDGYGHHHGGRGGGYGGRR